jgi:hypothetical protein
MDVDVPIFGEQNAAVDVARRQHRNSIDDLRPREHVDGRPLLPEQRHQLADCAPCRLLKGHQNPDVVEQRVLAEAGWRYADERRGERLELLQLGYRVPLDQRRRAAAGGVVARLLLPLEQQDVTDAPLRQKVGERGAGDPGADDDDLEVVLHPHHPKARLTNQNTPSVNTAAEP